MSTPDTAIHTIASTPCTEAGTMPATVLLVEDDRAVRRYLEVILKRAGYEVITAADGLEAMKKSLSEKINVVVTDAVMPHLGGVELCRFLRRQPKLKDMPIVLLSGIEQGVRTQEGTDRADIYLTKPVRPEELTRCLARLLASGA